MGLAELYEACTAHRNGILSDGSVKRVCSTLLKKIGKDPALTNEEKRYISPHIKDIPRADGLGHHAIATAQELIGKDYIKRWANVINLNPAYSHETFARCVASHLLDSGFSATHLHSFIKQKSISDTPFTLAQICEELHGEISANALRPFNVLVVYLKQPKLAQGIPNHWLNAQGISNWLKHNGFDTTNIRGAIGILLPIVARDPAGAAITAREKANRFAARALIATGEQLQLYPSLWVEGATEPFNLNHDSRGVRVRALYRENLVFESSENSSVDAAIELLAHLEGSSPTAAIAGGWGAIEGILADPGDRATAADNLATLVCCSLPRAELTAISYIAARQYRNIAETLRNYDSKNSERSQLMAEMIHQNSLPELKSLSDKGAVLRMAKILKNPNSELLSIKEAVAEAFHRLYRQRNLILHGGRLDSVSLTASLRTVAKLAGAGMDRITHGQHVQRLRPLELVARANLSLSLINNDSALSCVDLLEPH